MARVTINKINKAIAALGGKEELVKGNGYFYFASDEATGFWPETSVCTNFLNDLTLDQWVEEWKSKKQAAEHAKSMEVEYTLRFKKN